MTDTQERREQRIASPDAIDAERAGIREPADSLIDVEDLGQPTPPPFPDQPPSEEEQLERIEAAEEPPLNEEEQRDVLAGVWEAAFGSGGWWLGAGAPIPFVRRGVHFPRPLRAEVEAAWEIEPPISHRLARSTLAAMPRSWRESRAIARLPIAVLVVQVGVLIRSRIDMTEQIVEAYVRDHPPAAGEPVPQPARPAPASPDQRGAGGAPPGRAGDGQGGYQAPGLGLGAPVSARAAERRARRRPAGAGGPAG